MGYFTDDEMRCRCGRAECDAPPMDVAFMEKLNALRDKWGHPLVVTSGARCKWWNDKILGAKGSQHLLGRAADLAVANTNESCSLHALAEQLGFGGVEIGKGFIHVDTGPKRHWTYV